jgi:hypothetical protein
MACAEPSDVTFLPSDDPPSAAECAKTGPTLFPAGFFDWTHCRKQAWLSHQTNPNAFFYRHVAPGEVARGGPWTEAETSLVLEVLKEHPPGTNGWGLFSRHIPGRAGYQCRAHFKRLVAAGIIAGADEAKKKSIDCPTKAPIASPTKAPIHSPTKKPIEWPTKKPIEWPTKKLIHSPTKKPIDCPDEKSIDYTQIQSGEVDDACRYQLIDRPSFHFCEQPDAPEKTFGERLREFMSDRHNHEEFIRSLDTFRFEWSGQLKV